MSNTGPDPKQANRFGGGHSKKVLWGLFILLVAACIAWPAIKWPYLRWYFLAPLIAFVGLQMVALSSWKHKKRCFVITDYFYYLLLAGIVTLGAKFVHDAKRFDLENELAETDVRKAANNDDVVHLKQIDGELPILQRRLDEATRAADNIDPKAWADCLAEQMRHGLAKGAGNSGQRNRPGVIEIDPCAGLLEIQHRKSSLEVELEARNNERKNTANAIRQYEDWSQSPRPPDAGRKADTPSRNQYSWTMAFALLGVSLKLGKTTESLVSLGPPAHGKT